ncbi:hypothetical protein [Sporosarcina sp. ITBMC105]
MDGDYVALYINLAKKQGATDSDIKLAIAKVNEHNQITNDVATLQPFVTYDENGFNFDEEAAREANISEDLIATTVNDFESMNTVEPFASCKGKSAFEKQSYGFYTFFDSCETAKIINYIQIGAAIATLALAALLHLLD